MNNKLLNAFILLIAIILVNPQDVLAHQYKKDVLGESVKASDVEIQAISAGPGMLLPDNPFYFLDKGVQMFRIILAFSADQKVQVHERVAQERLAELRVMMAKNNSEGIVKALAELNKENIAAANELDKADAEGKDVKTLATKINENMKQQRIILASAASQSTGALRLQLRAASEDLKIAKVEVEDKLPEEELLKEIEETIMYEIDEDLDESSETAKGIERSVDVLTKLASEAAVNDQEKRELAFQRVLADKNTALKKQYELQLKQEKLKQEQLYKLKKEAAEQLKMTVRDAEEAAKKFEDAKKIEEELKIEQAKRIEIESN